MIDLIQSLEMRKLLTSTLGGHLLTITGTPANDVITMPAKTVVEIRPDGQLVPTLHITVVVNGVTEGDFAASRFDRVRVNLLDGNDYFSPGTAKGKKFRVTVLGGAGNDTIFGGNKPDALDGGLGDDILIGNSGSDHLISSAGSDSLTGNGGNDTADYEGRGAGLSLSEDNLANDGAAGETGNLNSDIETIVGGAGPDLISDQTVGIGRTILGLNGHNTLLGGPGDDTIFGGAHSETLRGGFGDDFLEGFAGRDRYYGDSGTDTVFSGDDNERDTVYSASGDDVSNRDFMDIVQNAFVTGEVYNDLNGNGAPDANEPGLAGRTVFIDVNKNGTLDAGDRSTTTDLFGDYSFNNLAQGTYTLRTVLPSGWTQTQPAGGAPIIVPVTVFDFISGQNFGEQMI